jgi:hypothetical protein
LGRRCTKAAPELTGQALPFPGRIRTAALVMTGHNPRSGIPSGRSGAGVDRRLRNLRRSWSARAGSDGEPLGAPARI